MALLTKEQPELANPEPKASLDVLPQRPKPTIRDDSKYLHSYKSTALVARRGPDFGLMTYLQVPATFFLSTADVRSSRESEQNAGFGTAEAIAHLPVRHAFRPAENTRPEQVGG